MDKVLFIDGMNALYRASIIFGGKPKSNDAWLEGPAKEVKEEQDDATIITFNFFRNLRPIIELLSPNKLYFCLEGHPQFRYDLYSDYKANRIIKQASTRKEAVDKIMRAKDIILPILQLFPITICSASNYEADDTIATLSENMKDEDLTILSGDNDYIQLLQRGYSHIKIYNPIKKTYLEAPGYFFVPYRCLVGDKSDNIPRLVSDKKALEYCLNPDKLQKFMDIEENRANFSINRKLIEFANVPLEEIDMVEGKKDFDAVRKVFSELKFETIVNDASWKKYVNTFDCISL